MLQDHVIEKYSVRFSTAPGIQKELIHTSITEEKDRIMEIIGDVFNEYFPEEISFEIDQIQLDLGVIKLTDFSSTYKARIKKLLSAEIEKLLQKNEFQEFIKISSSKTAGNKFSLLQSYLENGFNAVIQEDKLFSPDDFLLKLMEEDLSGFRTLMEKMLSQSKTRRRLKQLQPQTLQKLKDVLSDFRRKDFEKTETADENQNIYEIITRYFLTGEFHDEAQVMTSTDLEFLIGKLSNQDRRKLTSFFLVNLSDPSFVQRVSETLHFETVYAGFKMLESHAVLLEEWNLIQSVLFDRKDSLVTLPSYRTLFLDFLQLPLEAHEARSSLVYTYLIENGHSVAELKELIHSLNTTKEILENQCDLLESLKKKFADHIPGNDVPLASDVDALIYYFKTGILTKNNENLSVFANKQLNEAPSILSESLQKVWSEERVRYRLAHDLDAEVLSKIIEKVWAQHYTYQWWTSIKQSILVIPLLNNQVELSRHLYFLYFDFLSKYLKEQWKQSQFEDWFMTNLKHVLPVERTNKDFRLEARSKESTEYSRIKSQLLSSDITKEQSLQYRIRELSVLSAQGSAEEVQLYFEYYLERSEILKELFYKSNLSAAQWSGLWVSVPNRLLERIIAIVTYAHYSFIMELVRELKLLLVLNESPFSLEQIRRKTFLLALEIIRTTQNHHKHETFSSALIKRLMEEEPVLVEGIEDQQWFTVQNLPKLWTAIRNNKVKDQQEKQGVVSFEELVRVVQKNFPNFSGFVKTYLLAIEQFVMEHRSFSEINQEKLFVYVYGFLQYENQTLSASYFVRNVNRQVAMLYQILPGELLQILVKISKENIQQGKTVFYVLEEILRSLQNEEPDHTDTSREEFQKEPGFYEPEQIKAELLKEFQLSQLNFSRKVIVDYFAEGEIHKDLDEDFPSEEHLLKFIEAYAHDHEALFFQWIKEAWSQNSELENFLNRENNQAETLLFRFLAGNRYEEFLGWQKEIISFIHWKYPDMPLKAISIIAKKSLYYLLFTQKRSVLGVFSYVQQVIKVYEEINVKLIIPEFQTTIQKYKQEVKHIPLVIDALGDIIHSLGTDKSDKHSLYKRNNIKKDILTVNKSGDQAMEEIFLLVQQKSNDDIILYFEYYLEEGDLLRDMFFTKSIPLHFWTYLSEKLSDSLLERLLIVLTASQFTHFKKLLEELESLISLSKTPAGYEYLTRKRYALLFHTIHETNHRSDIGKIEQTFLKALFSTEYQLKAVLEKEAKIHSPHVSRSLPLLHAYVQTWSSAEKDLHYNIDSVTVDEIKKQMQKSYAHLSDVVTVFMKVMDEYFLIHSKIPDIAFYKSIYLYLHQNQKVFSSQSYVQEATLQIAIHQSVYLGDLGDVLLRITENFLAQGNTEYRGLKEILLLQGYKSNLSSDFDREQNYDVNKSHQEEFGQINSSDVFSFKEFEQLLQKNFSGISGTVILYVSILEKHFITHSEYSALVGKGRLRKRIYNYLVENKSSFSLSSFVMNTLEQLVLDYNLSKKEIGEKLLNITEAKLASGDKKYSVLRETLILEFQKAVPPIDDKPDDQILKVLSPDEFLPFLMSFAEFKQIVNEHFSNVAGFVFTYLQAIEESSLVAKVNKESLFITIYNFLTRNKEIFSAVSFVREINWYISTQHSLERGKVENILAAYAEVKNKERISRFDVLKEILDSQSIKKEEDARLPLLDLASDESFKIADELKLHHRKIQFDFFRRILSHYINEGLFPDLKEEGFDSVNEILLFLRRFFVENKGKIYPVIKELLSTSQALDNFLTKSDSEIKEIVLRELAGDRFEEFIQWNTEVERFLLWGYPETDKNIFKQKSRASLYRLLLNKDRITVGLFSYLEHAIADLKQQRILIISTTFPLLLEKYRIEGQGSTLFIKALERLEYLLAQKERDVFMKKIITKKDQDKKDEVTIEGRLLIHNAGLVLAGPFLYRYFDRLGMLENQQFKTEEMSHRAVQLLQFIVAGHTEMQEHELVLNKILCGVKLDTFIERNFSITEEEREVTESLLNGLLSNWERLKSSSIEALREAFLVRSGYLEQTESGWKLEVERKAMDILVDFIPWSFSLIKLSWMEKSLATVWKKSLDGV